MNILFITNIPSPYNLAYLEELGKLAKVVAIFERGASSERDESWKRINAENFDCVILGGMQLGVDMSYAPKIKAYIKKYRDYKIIIGNPATPTGICAISYCKRHKIPYTLQSEGGIPKDGKGLREKLKTKILSGAKLYLSGMSLKNEYFLHYGATPDRVRQYPFTSLYQSDILTELPTAAAKSELRKRLGMTASKIIISVGMIVYNKGHDTLLTACAGLEDDVGIYIVGGDATAPLLDIIGKNKMTNVHFIPFLDKKKLSEYYTASDLFVLATRGDTWGLVINEAMAKGLPVITTDNCVAGIELVENGVNGYIVKTEDADELRDRISLIISDDTVLTSMGAASLVRIQAYSYENMAQTVYDALK